MNGPLPYSPGPRPAATAHASSSISISDIYYLLFRHKWKLILCTLAGLIAAGTYYKLNPPPYQSLASLFIRFVISDGKSVGPSPDGATTKSPDQRGETIMASEVQILASLDLARQVAANVGPERILAHSGGGSDLTAAAAQVQGGLKIVTPPKSSIILVTFTHPDREIVQPVLREVVDQYLKMHVAIHRSVGLVDTFLTQETDQMRARLAQTEEELRRAIARAGVISIEDAKANFAVQLSRIRQDILNTQAEIAERSATLALVEKPAAPEAGPEASGYSSEQLDRYRAARARLEFMRRREQELLMQFTPESTRVKEARDLLAAAEKEVRQLESEFPALARMNLPSSTPGASRSAGGLDPATERARLAALESRIKTLNAQLEQIRAEASALDQLEIGIRELRRRQELEEANYRYFAASLEQARINEALGDGKVSNISQVQTPSPPFRDGSTRLKVAGGIAAGGLALGLLWSALIEFYLDRSVRRASDIAKLGRYPLFITIPRLKAKQLNGAANASSTDLVLAETQSKNGTQPAVWDASHALHPYHETLRDRMISFFDAKGLTHKPKLVAITSIGSDAGASTTAAGLASSLSRTGDGNVLLVDMTQAQKSAHHFQHGKPVQGLEETLEGKTERVQVQENLYLAGGAKSDELARALPRQFTRLMPKLRASDFDYIIFDMPPVSQISITPRLAEYMDMVFMVVESEKTSRDSVQRAADMLTETGANVGVVLNKNRQYVPARLEPVALG